MDLEIEIWSEELVDGHQTIPYQPGALSSFFFFWGGGGGGGVGVNCLVVFQTHSNLNTSLSNFIPIHVYPALSKHRRHDDKFPNVRHIVSPRFPDQR